MGIIVAKTKKENSIETCRTIVNQSVNRSRKKKESFQILDSSDICDICNNLLWDQHTLWTRKLGSYFVFPRFPMAVLLVNM